MTVIEHGKPAVTNFKVLERFKKYTLIELALETGRTHQIRVHMKYIGYPLVGDPVYGQRMSLVKLDNSFTQNIGFHPSSY